MFTHTCTRISKQFLLVWDTFPTIQIFYVLKCILSIVIIGVFQSAYFVLLSYVTALSYSAEVSFNLGLIKPFSLESGLSILSIIKNKIN